MPVFPPEIPDPDIPGFLLTDDYQYEFNGFLMGAGTPFVVEKISGLLGHAETRSGDIERTNSHGSIPVALLFSPRIIAFDVKVSSQHDGTAIEDLLDEISEAFQPPSLRHSTELDVFAYKRPAKDARQFFGRATKFDADSDFKVGRGLASASVEIVCNDPISYELESQSQTLVLGVGITSNSFVLTNGGTMRNGTPPLLYISGTATNPRISNLADDNRQLKLDVVLAANQICRVNMDTFEVAIQTGGGSNPWVEDYSIVRDDSQFFNLMPGNNTITYVRTGSAAASQLRVDWYDAWARG